MGTSTQAHKRLTRWQGAPSLGNLCPSSPASKKKKRRENQALSYHGVEILKPTWNTAF